MGTPSISKWYISLQQEKMLASVKLRSGVKRNTVVELPFQYIICDICYGARVCKECDGTGRLVLPDDTNLNPQQQIYFDLLLDQIMADVEAEDLEHIHP